MTPTIAKPFLILAASQALLAVVTGAFGAHALKELSSPEALTWWETASKYLMYHALAALFCAWCCQQVPKLKSSVTLFSLGNIFFSGSLFIMTLTGIKWLGAITPLGGILYIAGWGYMIWTFARIK